MFHYLDYGFTALQDKFTHSEPSKSGGGQIGELLDKPPTDLQAKIMLGSYMVQVGLELTTLWNLVIKSKGS